MKARYSVFPAITASILATVRCNLEVDLYPPADSPGKDKEANWLPARKATFISMLRLYLPKETAPSVPDGSWVLPPIQPVS